MNAPGRRRISIWLFCPAALGALSLQPAGLSVGGKSTARRHVLFAELHTNFTLTQSVSEDELFVGQTFLFAIPKWANKNVCLTANYSRVSKGARQHAPTANLEQGQRKEANLIFEKKRKSRPSDSA